jgi:hypothetical protein
MRRFWIWGITWVTLFHAAADAATLQVPWDYSTLHAALDVAVAGDTVLVGPGTYSIYEEGQAGTGGMILALAFLKSGVAMVSEAGPSATIIDHSDPLGDLGFYGFGQSDVLVQGFTFTGSGTGSRVSFGFGGTCTIRDCVFRDIGNGANSRAVGGVMSDFEIYDCTFRSIHGNAAPAVVTTSCTLRIEDSEFDDISPGAVRCQYDTGFVHAIRLEVRGCRFVDIGGAAAAVGMTATAPGSLYPVTIEDSWFERCVNSGTGPGAVLIGSLTPQLDRAIRNCTFVENRTEGGRGGAVALSGSSAGNPVIVEACTFYGNSQEIPWSQGGSAIEMNPGLFHLANNVFVENGGAAPAVSARPDVEVTTQCNVFWANPEGHVRGFTLDPTDVIADPEICNASSNDFTVQSSSPCLPQNNPSCSTLIGAWPAGCGAVSIEPKSWGRIKADYRSKGE